ncbi:hypothetical protein E2P81_ATG11129 [Venturia nashicola]|nr:hypothetical protein E2P81_ATG11129 [Venturia nashicola]
MLDRCFTRKHLPQPLSAIHALSPFSAIHAISILGHSRPLAILGHPRHLTILAILSHPSLHLQRPSSPSRHPQPSIPTPPTAILALSPSSAIHPYTSNGRTASRPRRRCMRHVCLQQQVSQRRIGR